MASMNGHATAAAALLGTLTVRLPQPVERQRALLARAPADTLLQAARREGLAGLLYANLRGGGLLASMPQQVRAELQAEHARIAASNLCKQAVLRRLAERLADPQAAITGITVLKGMALLDDLYDDPGMRATGDIDLYVAPAARAALADALHADGFVPQPLYPDTFRRGHIDIDVHTHLLGAGRVQARADILAAGEAPLLAGTRPSRYGARVTRLRVAAELLLACLHLWKHNADRLLWLVEINERVAALDEPSWQELVELGRAAGQLAALDRVAWLAELLLPETVAARLRTWAGMRRPPRFERRALERCVTAGALPAWAPLVFFSTQEGVAGRVRSIFETLFPEPPVLRQVFADPEAAIWRLYVRRIGQLIGIALR